MHAVLSVILWDSFWLTLSLVLVVKFLTGLLCPLLVYIMDPPFERLATKLSVVFTTTRRHELEQGLQRSGPRHGRMEEDSNQFYLERHLACF